LGFAPPSNNYLRKEDLKAPEVQLPLKLYVCDSCWLVQTEDYVRADELFRDDYAYFSSISKSWLDHAAEYVRSISRKLKLNSKSFVIEIACNDGYLLRNFVLANIPCLGIEPTGSTAKAAEALGIPVVREFFGRQLADKMKAGNKSADLIIGNNVYAHVPDINDFTAGMKTILKPRGTVTLEFPHILRLMENIQFDTIYHEHYSYLSLYTVMAVFKRAGLKVYDVEELNTHGGSLRIYGCHGEERRRTSESVARLLEKEKNFGLQSVGTYKDFQPAVNRIKNDLMSFLLSSNRERLKVAGYGAAAKANTFLNYAGIKKDLIPFVCDAAPSKQGKYLPGSHIPVVPVTYLMKRKPAVVLIFPWNIADEIMEQHSYIRNWGGKFVTAIPRLRILP
jgi:SAM-dependent methyltransferase